MLRLHCAIFLLVFIPSLVLGEDSCPAWESVVREILPAKGVSYNYFLIYGNSVGALKEDMLRKGPADNFGRQLYAYTLWTIDWTWPSMEDGTADFQNTEAEMTARFFLPCWVDFAKADSSLIEEWRRFYKAVLRHEWEHYELVSSGYKEVEVAIRKAATGTSGFSPDQAQQIAKGVVEKIREKDRELDLRTENGRLKGVVLTPLPSTTRQPRSSHCSFCE